MTGQSRLASAIEAVANVAIGYAVALATQAVVFPLFGMDVSVREHMAIGAVFTVVSLVRSYAVRRLFNAIGRLGWA